MVDHVTITEPRGYNCTYNAISMANYSDEESELFLPVDRYNTSLRCHSTAVLIPEISILCSLFGYKYRKTRKQKNNKRVILFYALCTREYSLVCDNSREWRHSMTNLFSVHREQ